MAGGLDEIDMRNRNNSYGQPSWIEDENRIVGHSENNRHRMRGTIVIVARKVQVSLRLFGFVASLTITASLASAQSSPQQAVPQPPQQGMSLSDARYVPPGYMTDMTEYWEPSGRIPMVLKPTPPGYVMGPDGQWCFNPPAGYVRPYSRSYGCLSQKMAICCQEKQSFMMYIRGYGPAIHTRKASILW